MLCLLYAPSPVNTMPKIPLSAHKIPDFSKRKVRQSHPKKRKQRIFSYTLRFIRCFFCFQRPVKRTLDNGRILLRTKFQLMAEILSLCAFLLRALWIEVPLHRKSAHFDKLYDNRQTEDRTLVLDIFKIPGVDAADLHRRMLLYALFLNFIIHIMMSRRLDNSGKNAYN